MSYEIIKDCWKTSARRLVIRTKTGQQVITKKIDVESRLGHIPDAKLVLSKHITSDGCRHILNSKRLYT